MQRVFALSRRACRRTFATQADIAERVLATQAHRDAYESLRELGDVNVAASRFDEIAVRAGVSEPQQLLQTLHDSGLVVHVPESHGQAAQVVLRPGAVAEAMRAVLNVQGGNEKDEFVQSLISEQQRIAPELEKLREQYSQLEQRAHGRATTTLRAAFAYFTLQSAAIIRLTWWELSWDIMEPVTYLLTMCTSWIGLSYFLRNNAEWSYDGWHDVIKQKRLEKLLRKASFRCEHYEALLAREQWLARALANPAQARIDHILDRVPPSPFPLLEQDPETDTIIQEQPE
ncbi:MAG: hypothetical protein MHM6MM_006804 [Cercozoa sp. M6MM]